MIRGNYRGIAAMAAPLVLLIGAGPAFAKGHHPGALGAQHAPIQGTVTDVSSTAIQINGTMSVSVAASTHVTRVVSGSLADIQKNQEVDLSLNKGTTTVNTIHLDGTKNAVPQHTDTHGKPKGHTGNGTGPHPGNSKGPSTHTKGTPHPAQTVAATHASGTVVSVSGSTITLRDRSGKSTGYTLASSVAVVKLLKGALTDLAIGQNVEVISGHNGVAAEITILNA